MKRFASISLMVVVLLGIFAVVNASQQPTIENTQDVVFDKILSDSLLLEKVYKAAIFAGMTDNLSLEQLDLSKGVHSTYAKWLEYTGSELGEGLIAEGIPQKPIFIMPIEGEIGPLRGWPLKDGEPTVYNKMLVIIFADSGDIAWASSYPTDVPFPDLQQLSNLKQ